MTQSAYSFLYSKVLKFKVESLHWIRVPFGYGQMRLESVQIQRFNHAHTGGYKKGFLKASCLFRNGFLSLSCTVEKEQKNIEREFVVGKYNKNIPRTGFILQSPTASYGPLDQTVYISVPGQSAMLLVWHWQSREGSRFWVQYRTVVPDVKTPLKICKLPSSLSVYFRMVRYNNFKRIEIR